MVTVVYIDSLALLNLIINYLLLLRVILSLMASAAARGIFLYGKMFAPSAAA